MKLTFFTASNYRSITNAYKIDLQDVTVFVGKNNEGKSNLIKAIRLAMTIINYVGITGRRMLPPRTYIWTEDFPVGIQNSKRLKNKTTEFRLDFVLDQEEVEQFRIEVGSVINGELSVYIVIKQDQSLSITMPKKGKNATALSNNFAKICKFIAERIQLQYIPAIRSETDAYSVINDIIETEFSTSQDERYKDAEAYIAEYQQRKLSEISKRINEQLSKFMPGIKNVELCAEERSVRKRSFLYGKYVDVSIDDGSKTSLSHKGDGVKSLTTMAILSQTSSSNRIILVDEPESHLHPEAIHYLRKVLYDLSANNQVVICTHSPIFVNRSNVHSNIVVNNNEAKAANRVDEVRKILGVMVSDNLIYSDYVVVVEGLTDKTVVEKAMAENDALNRLLSSNKISVRAIGGVDNLQAELYSLERYLCHYIVLLDNDEAGKNAAKKAQNKLSIPSDRFRYFIVNGMRESEMEDLVDPSVYMDTFMRDFGIDISKGQFKNKSKKWSKRIEEIASSDGRILEPNDIDDMKMRVSELATGGELSLSEAGSTLINSIIEKIKKDISLMS